MYTLTLERRMGKKTGDDKINAQVDYIVERGLGGGRGKCWTSTHRSVEPRRVNSQWVFQFHLTFEKTRGHRGGEAEYRQWEDIKAMVRQTGAIKKFQPYPWNIVAINGDGIAANTEELQGAQRHRNPHYDPSVDNLNERVRRDDLAPNIEPADFTEPISEINNVLLSILGVRDVQPIGIAKTWDDLAVPPELLSRESDRHLAAHPAWRNLYGVNPQIRLLLSNIRRAHQTGGESRNHAVLFGHSGCGKSTTLFCLEQMYGANAILKLDATSTTRAGLEKLFFQDIKGNIPPLVFMEEAEKADPEALKIWLGALDDRGEIRKVNFRVNQLRSVKVLFLCTVNNKSLFDKLMGSDGSEAGALSSRCVTQVYYPRPSDETLRMILEKEIQEKGGERIWIGPAIELARVLQVNDPRIVRSFLAGGERLMDGTYQQDWEIVKQAQKAFQRS